MTDIEATLLKQLETITQERDLLLKKCHQSEQAYTLLMDQLKQMLRHRFGQKSERYIDPENPQLSLIDGAVESPLNDTDVSGQDEPELPDNVVDIKTKKRRKKNLQGFADHLPRTEVVIAVKEPDKTCQCGCQKAVINHQRHERLNYIPPVYEVIVELREVVACPKGCRGEMVTAEKPRHILPKAKVTESVLAHIIVSKLDDRQPYYHLEKQFDKRAGFTYSRQTMARSTIDCANPLQPLFNLMKDEVIDYDVGALDATTLQVLNEPGRPARRKSYAYCFRGGAPGKAVILYEYNTMQ